MITSIVAAVVIFAVLIIVHEAGHFLVAKKVGVRVLRFSIGYPPRLFGIRRGETDYAIGATPLGGYVRMLGDEVAEEPSSDTIKGYLRELGLDLLGAARSTGWTAHAVRISEAAPAVEESPRPAADERSKMAGIDEPALLGIANDVVVAGEIEHSRAVRVLGRDPKSDEAAFLREAARLGSVSRAVDTLADSRPAAILERFNERAFPSQTLAKRFAIVLAGPASNLLFAPLLMFVVFMIGVPTALPVLGTVKQDMPAYAAGLRPGDRIMSVDGHPMSSWNELSDTVKVSNGRRLSLVVKRPDKNGYRVINITVAPQLRTEPTIYGNEAPTWVIGVMPRGDESIRSYPPLEALKTGFVETGQMVGTLFVGIAKIFEGTTPVRQALGGPIMIAQIAGKEAHQGFADVALFTVMLSLELGIINLLPVPLLDGGHLLFFVIEAIRGKPLQLRHREIAMQVGLFLLVVLMAFVILNDISRLVG